MTGPREQFIAELSADLEPVRPQRPLRIVVPWLGATAAFGVAVLLMLGPFRDGALGDLGRSPRFLCEALCGLGAVIALALGGLRLAVPDTGRPLRRAAPALLLLCAWVALYVVDLHWPSLPPSMGGKRPHCLLEALALGATTLAVGLFLARRLWPLHGAWCGLLLGLGAGALPALIMQFACMVVPAHTLVFHVLPALAMGLVGALLGARWLRRA